MAAAPSIFRPTGGNPFAAQVARNTSPVGETGALQGAGALPGQMPQIPVSAAQQRQAELMADPAYAEAYTQTTRAGQDAASQRQAAIRALAIQFGGLPSGFQDKYGDIDPATLALAKQNQFSQTAVANRQADQAAEADRQGVAASGLGNSGATPGVIGQENFQRGQALDTLGNNFGSAVGGAISDYANVLNTNAGTMEGALKTAEQDQKTNPAYATTATPVPAGNLGRTYTPPQFTPAKFNPSAYTRPMGPQIVRNMRAA